MIFGEKISKMGTISVLSLFSLLNVKTKFNNLSTYPKFCWYETGTTHIFHFGLSKKIYIFHYMNKSTYTQKLLQHYLTK